MQKKYAALDEDQLIASALQVLEKRIEYKVAGKLIDRPETAKQYFRLRLATLEHEVFSVLFLDNRHRIIACEDMFRGTIDGTSVHPREVVKTALKHNAAAVVFAHNHPSGNPEPSQADQQLTRRLKEALGLVDVRVLDHLVVGFEGVVSLADRGLV